jgi:hypothetical protein
MVFSETDLLSTVKDTLKKAYLGGKKQKTPLSWMYILIRVQ